METSLTARFCPGESFETPFSWFSGQTYIKDLNWLNRMLPLYLDIFITSIWIDRIYLCVYLFDNIEELSFSIILKMFVTNT